MKDMLTMLFVVTKEFNNLELSPSTKNLLVEVKQDVTITSYANKE
jgi:hypothetical protein